MNLERSNHKKLPTILSDSFLRSYSLSRIVKINEENRNKAKVAIMRKIREIKQTNSEKPQVTQFQSIYQSTTTEPPTNIRTLKEQLSIIDDGERVDTAESRIKKSRKACRNRKLIDLNAPQSDCVNNSAQHRRFKSSPQRKNNSHQTKQAFFLTKEFAVDQPSNSKMKPLLRMNNLKFDRLSAKQNSQNYNHSFANDNQQLDDPQSPLSTALNSFNRLKLMMNTKSSQNIMKHFYKRSLQNCTIDDIKYLIKMQGQKESKLQSPQNSQFLPMKFGKIPYLRRTFGSPDDDDASDKIQEKTVWKNEVLKRSFPIKEIKQNEDQKPSRMVPTNQLFQRDLKRKTSGARYKKPISPQKENQRTQQLLSKMTQKSAEMEKDLIFCYKNKRFPMNENKLNGIYKNWQKQHLKKKNIRQFQGGDHLTEDMQNSELKTYNIKLKRSQPQQQNVEQSTKLCPSQTSLMRNTSYEEQEYYEHTPIINL